MNVIVLCIRQLYRTRRRLQRPAILGIACTTLFVVYRAAWTENQAVFMDHNVTLSMSPVCKWLQAPTAHANGSIITYGDEVALLYDVIVDPSLRQNSGSKGGEDVSQVWGQREEDEFIVMKGGYFRLNCTQPPVLRFMKGSSKTNYLENWSKAIGCCKPDSNRSDSHDVTPVSVRSLTLALQRHEYVNIYFVMLTIYNAFLTMLTLGASNPRRVNVLLLDAHPQGTLDAPWSTLFGRVIRAGHLPGPTRFSALGWIPLAYNCPLRQLKAQRVDYIEEFRRFVLSGYGVEKEADGEGRAGRAESESGGRGGGGGGGGAVGAGRRVLDCSSLRMLFVWRRDYVAHPRNKNGKVSRKISNEAELLEEVKRSVPNHTVEARQLDAESMREQLRLVSQTDVLIGMHGAGLVHSLFLPSHASLVELYPSQFPKGHVPFKSIAGWRGLHYAVWQNKNIKLEKANQETYVPPSVVIKLINTVRQQMCGEGGNE